MTNTPENIPVDLEPTLTSSASTKTRETFKSAFFNFMRDFKKGHKHKHYQYVMRLGARRWNAMSQADRVPYVIEAAKNRRIDKPKSKPQKRNCVKKRKITQKKGSRSCGRRCPGCGHHQKSECRSTTGSISRTESTYTGTRSSKSYKSSN